MVDEINKIAAEVLLIKTLEKRGSDDLDYHNLSVWQIDHALAAVFMAGYTHGAAK